MYSAELTMFFNAIKKDERICAFHISLYMAMFQKWNLSHFQNPVHISRREMMTLSKINGTVTYHKYIKDLQAFGFIKYTPSYHPKLGSEVWFCDL